MLTMMSDDESTDTDISDCRQVDFYYNEQDKQSLISSVNLPTRMNTKVDSEASSSILTSSPLIDEKQKMRVSRSPREKKYFETGKSTQPSEPSRPWDLISSIISKIPLLKSRLNTAQKSTEIEVLKAPPKSPMTPYYTNKRLSPRVRQFVQQYEQENWVVKEKSVPTKMFAREEVEYCLSPKNIYYTGREQGFRSQYSGKHPGMAERQYKESSSKKNSPKVREKQTSLISPRQEKPSRNEASFRCQQPSSKDAVSFKQQQASPRARTTSPRGFSQHEEIHHRETILSKKQLISPKDEMSTLLKQIKDLGRRDPRKESEISPRKIDTSTSSTGISQGKLSTQTEKSCVLSPKKRSCFTSSVLETSYGEVSDNPKKFTESLTSRTNLNAVASSGNLNTNLSAVAVTSMINLESLSLNSSNSNLDATAENFNQRISETDTIADTQTFQSSEANLNTIKENEEVDYSTTNLNEILQSDEIDSRIKVVPSDEILVLRSSTTNLETIVVAEDNTKIKLDTSLVPPDNAYLENIKKEYELKKQKPDIKDSPNPLKEYEKVAESVGEILNPNAKKVETPPAAQFTLPSIGVDIQPTTFSLISQILAGPYQQQTVNTENVPQFQSSAYRDLYRIPTQEEMLEHRIPFPTRGEVLVPLKPKLKKSKMKTTENLEKQTRKLSKKKKKSKSKQSTAVKEATEEEFYTEKESKDIELVDGSTGDTYSIPMSSSGEASQPVVTIETIKSTADFISKESVIAGEETDQDNTNLLGSGDLLFPPVSNLEDLEKAVDVIMDEINYFEEMLAKYETGSPESDMLISLYEEKIKEYNKILVMIKALDNKSHKTASLDEEAKIQKIQEIQKDCEAIYVASHGKLNDSDLLDLVSRKQEEQRLVLELMADSDSNTEIKVPSEHLQTEETVTAKEIEFDNLYSSDLHENNKCLDRVPEQLEKEEEETKLKAVKQKAENDKKLLGLAKEMNLHYDGNENIVDFLTKVAKTKKEEEDLMLGLLVPSLNAEQAKYIAEVAQKKKRERVYIDTTLVSTGVPTVFPEEDFNKESQSVIDLERKKSLTSLDQESPSFEFLSKKYEFLSVLQSKLTSEQTNAIFNKQQIEEKFKIATDTQESANRADKQINLLSKSRSVQMELMELIRKTKVEEDQLLTLLSSPEVINNPNSASAKYFAKSAHQKRIEREQLLKKLSEIIVKKVPIFDLVESNATTTIIGKESEVKSEHSKDESEKVPTFEEPRDAVVKHMPVGCISRPRSHSVVSFHSAQTEPTLKRSDSQTTILTISAIEGRLKEYSVGSTYTLEKSSAATKSPSQIEKENAIKALRTMTPKELTKVPTLQLKEMIEKARMEEEETPIEFDEEYENAPGWLKPFFTKEASKYYKELEEKEKAQLMKGGKVVPMRPRPAPFMLAKAEGPTEEEIHVLLKKQKEEREKQELLTIIKIQEKNPDMNMRDVTYLARAELEMKHYERLCKQTQYKLRALDRLSVIVEAQAKLEYANTEEGRIFYTDEQRAKLKSIAGSKSRNWLNEKLQATLEKLPNIGDEEKKKEMKREKAQAEARRKQKAIQSEQLKKLKERQNYYSESMGYISDRRVRAATDFQLLLIKRKLAERAKAEEERKLREGKRKEEEAKKQKVLEKKAGFRRPRRED